MITAGVTIRCRSPEYIPELIYLSTGLIQRGAKDVAGSCITERGEFLAEVLVYYLSS